MAGADQGGDGGRGAAPLSDDTIVALSSGQSPAAIAIIRLSGPAAFAAAEALVGSLPAPRQATLRSIRDGDDLLDRGLVLVFAGPASATGEDLVELHCHGGRAVTAAVEAALLRHAGVRRAQPGEFTRRALVNGRIDLSQAQGLADLLRAETEAERRIAIAAAEGVVSRTIAGWIDRLTTIAAQLEASIDFAEEDDVAAQAASLDTLMADRDAIIAAMAAVLAAPPVEAWREGWRVVLAGPPNVGKSTLINLLAGRDASIVTPIAGTTRDRIEVPVSREGIGYLLVDTAGMRDATEDAVEMIGIARARAAIETADLVVWLGDDAPSGSAPTLWVHARADDPGRTIVPPAKALAVSRDDPASIGRLWAEIAARLSRSDRVGFALHRDDRRIVEEAWRALVDASADLVLVAESVRTARHLLATWAGTDATEDLLDRIFGQFCVGK